MSAPRPVPCPAHTLALSGAPWDCCADAEFLTSVQKLIWEVHYFRQNKASSVKKTFLELQWMINLILQPTLIERENKYSRTSKLPK